MDGGWVLELPPTGLARLEYKLELSGHDGDTVVVCDPGNPQRAPGRVRGEVGAHGPRLSRSGLARRDRAAGNLRRARRPRARPRARDSGVVARGRTAAAAGRPRRPRVRRTGRADPLRRRDDRERCPASVSRRAAAARRSRRVVLGLGGVRSGAVQPDPAGDRRSRRGRRAPRRHGREPRRLAMLQAQRTWPGTFAGLFLQSAASSFRASTATNPRFPRYARIVRFVRRRAARDRLLRAGAGEHDLRDRGGEHPQQPADGERAGAQGYAATLAEVPDLHNYTGWRDALDPHLTRLLAGVWARR